MAAVAAAPLEKGERARARKASVSLRYRPLSVPFRLSVIMEDNNLKKEFLENVTEQLRKSYSDGAMVSYNDDQNLPQRERVLALLNDLLELLFPGYSGKRTFHRDSERFSTGERIDAVYHDLTKQLTQALCYREETAPMPTKCEACTKRACGHSQQCLNNCREEASQIAKKLLLRLPELRELLKLDCQAALDGDPATRSMDEIILAYPGFKAIAIHRIAHELYVAGIPLIPRIMSEYAHTVTGIDINPGATIGKSFFIDHGTGVVIGETAVLGDNVKLYQGVTLGALSFPKDGCGKIIKGNKRHPNLENDVTVYAGATILGDVTIAHHSIIGGNVWLTESISEPYSRVIFSPSDISITVKKGFRV
jgi:serine O-acetyltransferase